MKIIKTVERTFNTPTWYSDLNWIATTGGQIRVEQITERYTVSADKDSYRREYRLVLTGHRTETDLTHLTGYAIVAGEPDLSDLPPELSCLLMGDKLAGLPCLP
jgi:hypothetical protein